MNYKIPSCGCSCANSNNNAVIQPKKTYKLLTDKDAVVSLQNDMIAELDFDNITPVNEEKTEGISTTLLLDAATCEERGSKSMFLRIKDPAEEDHPFAIAFCSLPFDDETGHVIDRYPLIDWNGDYVYASEEVLHSYSSDLAYNFWHTFAQHYEQSDSGYGCLKARTSIYEFYDYPLSRYLEDFPYMMSYDDIIWYLGELYRKGFFSQNQKIIVPLTDRIHLSGADFRSEGTYLYFAVFGVDSNNSIQYYRTVGAYAFGDSMYNLMISFVGAKGTYPALVFCQKRKSTTGLYEIPIEVPANFNTGGKAIIRLHSLRHLYIRLKATGSTFMPLFGDNLVWENTKNSCIIPIHTDNVGTIELETIKRGEDDTILVSDHLGFYFNGAGSTSDSNSNNGDIFTDFDEDDILDTDSVHSIYSSC